MLSLSFQFKPAPLVLLSQIILYFSSVSLSQLLRLQDFQLTWARTILVLHQCILQLLHSVQSILHIQWVFVEWILRKVAFETAAYFTSLKNWVRHTEQQDFVLHSAYLVIFRIMVSKNNYTCSQIKMEYGVILVLFKIRKAFLIIWDG